MQLRLPPLRRTLWRSSTACGWGCWSCGSAARPGCRAGAPCCCSASCTCSCGWANAHWWIARCPPPLPSAACRWRACRSLP
ncbi:MAG: hypothetical protein DCF18_00150 [Cyanobium sp.]|nr:MAG: hypothetical protein DCF18_00150 [Cyanobium sp.]